MGGKDVAFSLTWVAPSRGASPAKNEDGFQGHLPHVLGSDPRVSVDVGQGWCAICHHTGLDR